MPRNWSRIIILWLFGVLAAAQLTKLATLAPFLKQTFDLSLPAVGLLVSLLEIGGASLGLLAGVLLAKASVRAFLPIGLGLLAATSLVEAIATTTAMLFVSRAIEGLGYLLVVVACPTAIVGLAEDRDRSAALTLWSTFVPIGAGIGSLLTGLAIQVTGPRGAFYAWSALALLGAAASLMMSVGGDPRRTQRLAWPAMAAWLSAASFGCYTMFVCALTALLPTFLVERNGVPIDAAGPAASLVPFGALLGTAASIFILRPSRASRQRSAGVTTATLLAAAFVASFIFGVGPAGRIDTLDSVLLAFATIALAGVTRPLLFSRLPLLAGAERPDDPRIPTANGLLTQFGAGGALLGPPLGSVLIATWDWNALGIGSALLLVLMLVLQLSAEALVKQV